MRKAIITTCLATLVSSCFFAAADCIELNAGDASVVIALDGARVLSYVVLGWFAPAGSFVLFPHAFDLQVTVRLSACRACAVDFSKAILIHYAPIAGEMAELG